MRVVHYPCSGHLVENVFKGICSEHGGIMQSLMVGPVKYTEGLDIKSLSAQMPYYHKVLLDPGVDVQYHLTGYGTFYEEAIIRLVGEAIERYALMVSQYAMTNRVRYASYREISGSGRVIPFEYLQLFSDEDYAKLNAGKYRGLSRLGMDDVIGWLKLPSLFRAGEEIWVPVQMLFVGYKVNCEVGERGFTPAFSTGTAAHGSLEDALLNALLELVEIDALMVNWYTKRQAPSILVDDMTLCRIFSGVFGEQADFELLGVDLKVLPEVDAHVFGTVVVNTRDQRPLITYGAQGHLDPVKGFYRSCMEAVAIAFLGIYGPLYSPKEYFCSPEGEGFTDLDTNVAFFASPGNAAAKRELIHGMLGGEKLLTTMPNYQTGNSRRDLAKLIRQLSAVSEYGVYLDVTPPEARSKGWHVMRAFIPELLTMCVPGVPYARHPRFGEFGGITNAYPHPLP